MTNVRAVLAAACLVLAGTGLGTRPKTIPPDRCG